MSLFIPFSNASGWLLFLLIASIHTQTIHVVPLLLFSHNVLYVMILGMWCFLFSFLFVFSSLFLEILFLFMCHNQTSSQSSPPFYFLRVFVFTLNWFIIAVFLPVCAFLRLFRNHILNIVHCTYSIANFRRVCVPHILYDALKALFTIAFNRN